MTEEEYFQGNTLEDDEITVDELRRIIWAGRWLIAGSTVAAVIIAVLIALMLPNIYRAEALLVPNQHDSAGGIAGLAAQYGGLASLAGIDLGMAKVDKTELGLKTLASRKFITNFIDRRNILVQLMAAEGWDSETGELRIDPDDYDIENKNWVRKVRSPKTSVPSTQEAYEEFTDIFSIDQDKDSGFIVVSVEHFSPNLAKKWVDWLVEDINSTMLRQDVAEAERAIAYLRVQIASTSLADLQTVFFRLIEEQTKTVMLANVSPEYLLRSVDPAVVPEERTSPRRGLIVIAGSLIGAMLSVFGVLVANGSKSNRAR